jgi:hypothetical protein
MCVPASVGVNTVGIEIGEEPEIDPGWCRNPAQPFYYADAGALVAVDAADDEHLGGARVAPLDRDDWPPLHRASEPDVIDGRAGRRCSHSEPGGPDRDQGRSSSEPPGQQPAILDDHD